VLDSLPIILNVVLLNGLLVASPQDGAMTMNITLATIVLNSLANKGYHTAVLHGLL